MRVVAVGALQLTVAAAPHGVGVFRRVPGRHTARKPRTVSGVTAAAGPIDVVMRPPQVGSVCRSFQNAGKDCAGRTRAALSGSPRVRGIPDDTTRN